MAILAVTAVQAQSYITLSADTSYATSSPDEIHKAEVVVTNNGPDGQNMTWVRVVNDKPEEWETSVCDPNLCWAPFADALDMDGFSLPEQMMTSMCSLTVEIFLTVLPWMDMEKLKSSSTAKMTLPTIMPVGYSLLI